MLKIMVTMKGVINLKTYCPFLINIQTKDMLHYYLIAEEPEKALRHNTFHFTR